jgi:hypothetical protein
MISSKRLITAVCWFAMMAMSISAFSQDEGGGGQRPIGNADTNRTALNTLMAGPSAEMPEGCTAGSFDFQGNGQLILGSQQEQMTPQLYLIHNKSDFQLLLNHPSASSAGIGWASALNAGQWSAIVMNIPNFAITCFGRGAALAGYMECKSVIELCSYKKTNLSGSESSYWAAENKSLADVLDAIQGRGISTGG